MRKMWSKGVSLLVIGGMALSLAACTKAETSNTSSVNAAVPEISVQELEKAAKAEGEVISVGMPDSWANWKDTWADLSGL